jgi:hypothetical protein
MGLGLVEFFLPAFHFTGFWISNFFSLNHYFIVESEEIPVQIL